MFRIIAGANAHGVYEAHGFCSECSESILHPMEEPGLFGSWPSTIEVECPTCDHVGEYDLFEPETWSEHWKN